MQIFSHINDLQNFLEAKRKQGLTVGFVPTMGALHNGHLSLMKRAKSENDILIASVFVNPIQFNNPTDLEKYPRTPEKDAALLETVGCDAIFMPSVEEMYPVPETKKFNFGQLEQVMEGACRPGHFNGVGIVVKKFFEIVKPNKAYFGEKDFQQLAIIKKMVKDYDIPLEIVPCPIVREEDGLAMSSRNVRLTPEDRTIAPMISTILHKTASFGKKFSPEEMQNFAINSLNDVGRFNVEYVVVADEETLQSLHSWKDVEHARIFVALQLGAIRLIDNVRIF